MEQASLNGSSLEVFRQTFVFCGKLPKLKDRINFSLVSFVLSSGFFDTVICHEDDVIDVCVICNDLFDINIYWYAEDEFDDDAKLIYHLLHFDE